MSSLVRSRGSQATVFRTIHGLEGWGRWLRAVIRTSAIEIGEVVLALNAKRVQAILLHAVTLWSKVAWHGNWLLQRKAKIVVLLHSETLEEVWSILVEHRGRCIQRHVGWQGLHGRGMAKWVTCSRARSGTCE